MAESLTMRVTGTSVFLFGWADARQNRGLAQRRREMGWFKRSADTAAVRPDLGPSPQTRYGITGQHAGSTLQHSAQSTGPYWK